MGKTNESSNNGGSVVADDSPKTTAGMMKALQKQSKGTNVLQESMTTLASAEGSEKKGDILVEDQQQALTQLRELISTQPKVTMWEFRTSPHEQFGKTLEDTYLVFVQWARSKKQPSAYNVSKAFRRLAAYAEWMESCTKDLSEPLTVSSVKEALGAWAILATVDRDGTLIWWVDYAQMDKKAIKNILSPSESVRAMVWFTHYMLFHPNAKNGAILIQNAAKIPFLQAMTLLPMEVGVKLDRLAIGILPVKIKAAYIVETPSWMNVFMKLIGVFMSRKMKERLVLLKSWSELQQRVGNNYIPTTFGNGVAEGTLQVQPPYI